MEPIRLLDLAIYGDNDHHNLYLIGLDFWRGM